MASKLYMTIFSICIVEAPRVHCSTAATFAKWFLDSQLICLCRPMTVRFCPRVQDGLVKSNMKKLTNYVHLSPEKLDRIGEYLESRVSRDIYRRRTG